MESLHEQHPDAEEGAKIQPVPERVDELCPRCARNEVLALTIDGKHVACCNLCGEQFPLPRAKRPPAKRKPAPKRKPAAKRKPAPKPAAAKRAPARTTAKGGKA